MPKVPKNNRWPISRIGYCAATILSASVIFFVTQARAALTDVPLGNASNYAVLYDGTGGNNLSISNVTVNGNVGVGGTGQVQFSGPGTINGELDFSAANTGQFHNTNGGNVGPTSVNFNELNVTTDLSNLSSLSTTLGALTGNNLAINGVQAINESAGALQTSGGVTYRVFNVTSFSDNNGQILTINGDGSGDPVVFNFPGSLGNVNLQGAVSLTGGLADDQILWNFDGGSGGTGGVTASLNTNASSNPTLAWQGILLDPNGPISLTNAILDGRVFGGDSQNMQIVSGDTINAPATSVPEPGTLALFTSALAGFGLFRRRKRS